MTITSQLITDAFRTSNLLALGVQPTDLQKEEALRYLSRLVKSVYGNEVGEPLISINVGRKGIERPSGYPYDDLWMDDWFIPTNVRLVLNVEESHTLFLSPYPNDGQRFGVIDVQGNLAQYPVTLKGNGCLIEGSASIILDTNNLDAEWMFRADRATWVKYSPIALEDTFPFPEEFDEFFVMMLAMRLNPAYGATIDPQAQTFLSRARSQLRSRYTQTNDTSAPLPLIRLSKTAADRDLWTNWTTYQDHSTMFNRGWTQ